MKKWLAAASTLVLMFCAPFASAADVDSMNPYTLINGVADSAFSRLKADKDTYQANPELLRQVVVEELMPHINVRLAALKVLGPRANKASKDQRDQFTAAFYDYLVASYARILTQYTDQNVTVEPEKAIDPKRKVVSVRVDIVDSSRPPIRLDFKLRKNGKTGEWQGFDVVVEGVSMLDTTASEWSGQLRKKNGIETVAKEMVQRAKAPITKEETES
ncbi:ABC transporter substrate-binding protein [Enterovibrio nigricans]|uniref:Phospholipid transport system substrate-binding protein n=1 Tax=Enterovibrio nigricans DSM 22720 TaxID=1121868 RepID=A0A1T4TWJ8_9GAMM|nr:ABC transporter substrate-binding protein [Enterovibrio nigricans]PKF51456.1 toluene tolerance protein [Enterovibrio nigricans]SKA44837.1 phospholipid transport system substrate-binding protein [Enterovibrio nigricans DSM 22720]